MCDYSLMGVPNRLARCGEDLVTHRFHTGTLGLTAVADHRPKYEARPKTFWASLKEVFASPRSKLVCAVCVPPGAQLLLQDIPVAMQRELNVEANEHVTFTQVSAETNSYRDAVMFANGKALLLQRLAEGQRARMLSLSSDESMVVPGSRMEEAVLR